MIRKIINAKKLGALVLALILLLSSFAFTASVPAALAAELTDEYVYETIIAQKEQYPEGMRFTNADYRAWKGGFYDGGYGCVGFAFMLSDAVFDNLPARYCTDFHEIRVGDVVRINKDKHSVIILKMNGANITIAEANYNKSVHWGRTFTYEEFSKVFNYALTRYPKEDTPVVEPTPEPPLESADDVLVPGYYDPMDEGPANEDPADDDDIISDDDPAGDDDPANDEDPDSDDDLPDDDAPAAPADSVFYINLTTETLHTAAGYRVASYSVDGGVKWKALKDAAQNPADPKSPFHPTKLSKLFKSGKTTELWISEGVLAKNSAKQKVPGGDTPAAIVKFGKIDAADKNEVKANKLSVNYLINADNSGRTSGNWVLAQKKAEEASVAGILFGPAVVDSSGKAGKTVSGWYKARAEGVGVDGTIGSKTVYFYRVAPKEKTGSANWAAGGKPAKVTVKGLGKAPKVGSSLKVKSGAYFSTDGVTFMKGPDAKLVGVRKLFIGATAQKPRSAIGG